MPKQQHTGFTPATTKFLTALRNNNDRDWFNANRQRYENDVVAPALNFIAEMDGRLKKISPHFRAIPKKTGGSLMRVYRDTRFAKDKTPYKTNIGVQFRHELGKDVHAPGFYVHIEPQEVFLGVGIWRPDAKALAKIREMIADNPNAWRKARDDKKISARFELRGDSLKRPPRGFDAGHPLIDDLKRKDFISVEQLTVEEIYDVKFADRVNQSFALSKPLMRFLCHALDLRF
jgi:uncharacterized protein (TIGR02453 family)